MLRLCSWAWSDDDKASAYYNLLFRLPLGLYFLCFWCVAGAVRRRASTAFMQRMLVSQPVLHCGEPGHQCRP